MHNLFEATQDSFIQVYNLLRHICQVLPAIVSFQERSKVRGINILCRCYLGRRKEETTVRKEGGGAPEDRDEGGRETVTVTDS